MKYSCIPLGLPSVQEHLAFLEKELNYDFTPKQLVTIWNRWVDNDVTKLEGLPTVDNIVETYTKIENTSSEDKFQNESISEKTDILDYLQHIYFQGISALSKSPVLTRQIIKEFQPKVFEKMPSILRKKGLESVADNFEKYKEYLVKQRLQKFNVPEEIDETEVVKDTISSTSSVFTDVFNSGSDEAKWLIASLKSNEDNNGVPRPVSFTEVKNILQNYLGNSLTFVDQANSLVAIKDKYYWVPELMEKLGIVDTNDFMPEAIYGSVRTSFSEAFAKQLSDISITSIGGKDSFSAIDSKQKLDIKEKAQTNFWSSFNSKVVGGSRILDVAKYKAKEFSLSEKDLIDFLSFFGMNFNPGVVITPELKADIIQVKKAVEKAINNNQDVQWIDDKFLDVSSRVQNILQAQVPFEKENKQLSVSNAEGKQQHAVSNHNYYSRTVSRLKSGIKKATNAFEKLFSEGKAITDIISGAQNGEDNDKTSSTFNSLNITDVLNTQLTDMFSSKPTLHLPRTEAKTTERGFTITDTTDLNEHLAYTNIDPRLITNLYKAFESDKAQTFHPNWNYAKDSSPLSFWESLGIEPNFTRDQFDRAIRTKIQSLQVETYKILEENKLFVKSDGGLKVLFSDAALLKMGWNESPKNESKENYQRGLLLKLINNYNFNNLYFGILSTQTLQGSMSGVNLNNFFKRTAGPVAESRTPRVDSLIVEELNAEMRQLGLTTFDASTLTIQIHSETENPTTDKKILAISENYAENNEDDAQGIMVFPMYKAILKMSSQWNDNQEKAYQKIMKGEQLSKDEKGLFPPIKPVGFSVVNKDGHKIPVYIKTAVYPMSPADIAGTANEAKYKASIERGIGLWIPKSGIKMATPKTLKKVSEGINEDAIVDFPMADFGIQLDIMPKESTKQLIGTQQRKLKWANLFEFGKSISDKFKKLLQEDKDNIQAMSNIQREKLYKEMGIEEVDGDITIKNFSKFKELIKDELIARENPINTIEAIDDIIDEDGNVILTMDSVPARQKIMNMLNAIINNRIIKQYTNGSALVQISQQGWEMPVIVKEDKSKVTNEDILAVKTAIDFVNDEAKINYYNNKGLSFFKIDTTTGAAECLLPAKFKKYVNEDGTIDPKLLISIGYRIPTQGHNSMLHLKVIGFLPSHLDQMIVLPKEITTQSGGDFDVDKINIFIPNVTADGRYISPEMDAEKEYNDFKTKLDTLLAYIKDGLERKRLVIAEELSIDEFAERLKRDGSIKLTEEEIKNTLEFAGYKPNILSQIDKKLEKLDDKEAFIQNFKEKQLQNKNIEITVAVLESEEVVKSLITPNSPGALKQMSEDITKKLNEAKKPLKNLKIELSNMFNGVTLAKISNQMFASKALVGIFASQSTHHTLAQQVGLHFKTTKRPFYFNHNQIKIKGEIYSNLSAIFNKAGELISDILGNNYLTAAVDSAKDDYLTELGVNLETGSSVALFERMGGERDYMVAWFNQPIIQDYINLNKYYKSITYKATSKREKTKTDIINEIVDKYKLGKDNLAYLLERKLWLSNKLNEINSAREAAGMYNVKDLQSNWFYGSVSGKVNQLEMIKNLFDDYLYFEEASRTLSKSISTTKFDTSGPGKDIVESEQLKNDYVNFVKEMNGSEGYTLGTIEDGNLAPYERLVTDTLLNTFYKNSWSFVIPLYKPLLMLYRNFSINSALLNLINTNGTMVVKKAKVQEGNNIYGGLINYVLQNSRGIDTSLFFNPTGQDETDNTVGKKIIDIQNDTKHILHNNAVIQDLFNVKRSNNPEVPTLLMPRYRNYSVDDSTTFTRAFEEIKQLDPNLYEDLLTVSLFQTGVVQSPSSFYNLIPHKDTAEIFNNALKGMDANTMDYVKGIMENIGNKLSNLKTMSFDFPNLPNTIKMEGSEIKASEGYDFIKVNGDYASAIYQRTGENVYTMLDETNYNNLFYNYTNKAQNIGVQDEYDDYDGNRPSDDEIAYMKANQPQTSVTTDTEISKKIKDIINANNLEKEDYEIVLVNGIETLVILVNMPKTIKKGYTVFYSDYLNNQGLYKRAGKKLVVPGFEDIRLMLDQESKAVIELSTGLMVSTQSSTQAKIIEELEDIFKTKNVRSVLENAKKIIANQPGVIISNQPQITVTQRTFKDEKLHQAYIKGGLEAVTKLIRESNKKELDAAKQLSKEVDMLEEFEKLNSKLNKTNSENDRLIELYTILKNSKELDFEYSLNELGLTTQPQVTQDAWSSLSLQQMTNLGKMGITKELFNNSSIEEQQKAIKCHG